MEINKYDKLHLHERSSKKSKQTKEETITVSTSRILFLLKNLFFFLYNYNKLYL